MTEKVAFFDDYYSHNGPKKKLLRDSYFTEQVAFFDDYYSHNGPKKKLLRDSYFTFNKNDILDTSHVNQDTCNLGALIQLSKQK